MDGFPHLHGRPPLGWINDPNGCSYVDGRYHVFFQFNPDAPVHGSIRWGHMSSADLVRWRPEPVALRNRPGEIDAYGCWSGCVVDDGGVPTAVYSAVRSADHRAETVLARSDRTLETWRQDRTSVMTQPDDPAITDVRDPFLFTVDGHRYAIQGAGHDADGPARILVYACDDLTSWTPLGALLTAGDPVAAEIAPAQIWECPNLVRLGDRWVLVVSLLRAGEGLAGVRYLVGDLAPGPRFVPVSGGHLDAGPCFYAPHLLVLDDRVLMWGWAWELDRTPEQVAAAGWAGSLTFVREVELIGDALRTRPASELARLRTATFDAAAPTAASAFDVLFDPAARRMTLELVDGGVSRAVVDLPIAGDEPRILVDGSMIEAFSDVAFTTRAYPTPTSRWLVRSDGPVRAWLLA